MTYQNSQIFTLAIEQVLFLCGGRLMEQCYLWSIGTQNHLQRVTSDFINQVDVGRTASVVIPY